MRNILLLVAVVAIAVTAYFLMVADTAEPPVASVTQDAAEPEDTAASATGSTQEAVEDAVTTTQEAVEDAVGTATEAATNAVSEAANAVDAATETATDSAAAAVEEASDAATEALESATQTLADTNSIDSVLTEEGFDFDKAVELVDASDLSAIQKTSLKTGLEQARDNPELLAQVLEQARAALGL